MTVVTTPLSTYNQPRSVPGRLDPRAVAGLAASAFAAELATKPQSVVDWPAVRSRAATLAEQAYQDWGRGALTETAPKGLKLVQRYISVGLGVNPTKARRLAADRTFAWSAAFIGYVLRGAGAGRAFGYGSAHRVYVAHAKARRLAADSNAPIWAYRITEIAPRVGDIIVNARCPSNSPNRCGVTFDNVDRPHEWAAHGDIVVGFSTDARGPYALVIGGNTADQLGARRVDTVGKKKVRLNRRGFVVANQLRRRDYFAIIRVGPEAKGARSESPPSLPLIGPLACGKTLIHNFIRETKPSIKIWQLAPNVYAFSAGMQIDADGAPRAYHPNNGGLDYNGNAGWPPKPGKKPWGIALRPNGSPYIQGLNDPAPGYFVSPTALADRRYLSGDPRRYVDSTKIAYIALPSRLAKRLGLRLGDLCFALRPAAGTASAAVFADIGPAHELGEGSIALAQALRHNPFNTRGRANIGIRAGIIYVLFAGSGNGKPRGNDEISLDARQRLANIGGERAVVRCFA